MKYYAKPLNRLIGELSRLPGIGGKTAQRLAFHILSMEDREAFALADAIREAKQTMKYCSVCGNLTDEDPCSICRDESRDRTVICVVESPKDVIAMEKIREFKGLYHVLHGAISPMDGIAGDPTVMKWVGAVVIAALGFGFMRIRRNSFANSLAFGGGILGVIVVLSLLKALLF